MCTFSPVVVGKKMKIMESFRDCSGVHACSWLQYMMVGEGEEGASVKKRDTVSISEDEL